MIPTPKGNHLLMMNGYTFAKDNRSRNYYCSKRSSGCRARVKLSLEGEVVQALCAHIHDPPKYIVSTTGGLKFIYLSERRRLLMSNNYTFAQTVPGYWYCSKKSKGCKARIALDRQTNALLSSFDGHNHPPPVYMQTNDGYFRKVSS